MSFVPSTFEATLTDAERGFLEDYLNPIEERIASVERGLRLEEGFDSLDFGRFPPDTSMPSRIPLPTGFRKVSQTNEIGTAHVVVSWVEPERKDLIDRYELWIRNLTGGTKEPRHLEDVLKAPFGFEAKSDVDVTAVVYLRPVLKDGRSLPALDCPSVAFDISTTATIDGDDLADESVGDAKLDRTTDPIVVQTADIANAAIVEAKIGTAAITTAKIANAAVGTAQIANAAITNALIANLAVDTAQIADAAIVDAKILSLSAAKITTGTLDSLQYTLTSGSNTMTIDGTNGFRQQNTSLGTETRLADGTLLTQGGTYDITISSAIGVNVQLAADTTDQIIITDRAVQANQDSNIIYLLTRNTSSFNEGGSLGVYRNGSLRGALIGSAANNRGELYLYNSGGTSEIEMFAKAGSNAGDSLVLKNSSGANRCTLGIFNGGSQGIINCVGTVSTDIRSGTSGQAGLYVGGNRVVASQQATVSDPSGGATVDSEARTAINAIIDRLQAHGLIS